MATVRVRPGHLPSLLRRLLAEDTDALRRAALDTVLFGEVKAVERTNEAGLVDRGLYKLGWGHSRLPKGAELHNRSPHAPVLEWGRRAGAPGPPLKPIREWARRKLVGNGKIPPEDLERVARAVRDHIHRHGTKPHGILRLTYEDMRVHFREAAKRELARSKVLHRKR